MSLSKNLPLILTTVFLSTLISTVFAYQIAKDTLNKEKQFRVVDIKQLSESLMENIHETIKEQGTDINPEFVEIIAQNEAKKLFTTIANEGGPNDIIMPKSSVIHVPQRYEITERIAEKMGLKGVVVKSLSESTDKDGANDDS